MAEILLARAAYLLPYYDILAEIGAPVHRYIEAANLPSSLERDDYFPVVPSLRFRAEAAWKEGIMDFGFHAAKRIGRSVFCGRVLRALADRSTLYGQLSLLSQASSWEGTHFRLWMTRHGDSVRVNSTLVQASGVAYQECVQWFQNMLPVYVVRQFVGPAWCPANFAFQSRFTPCREAQEHFGNTRFLSGEKTTWIDIPERYLTLSRKFEKHAADAGAFNPSLGRFRPGYLEALKIMLRPYVRVGFPGVELVSEIAGLSVRTLQRRLAKSGMSYSDLVQLVRHEIASEYLVGSDLSITEIAHAIGYSDSSHFTRAFRRVSGIAPREFRRMQYGTAA